MEVLYSEDYLIDRVYNELNKLNRNDNKLKLSKPMIKNENKKTFFLNFRELCLKLSRNELDIQKFISDELSSKSSIDVNGVLILHGIYKYATIQNNIEKFIMSYVLCTECKSHNTIVLKEKSASYLLCNSCKSKKCVNL